MIYILGASSYQLLCWAISVLRLLVPSQPSSHSPSSGQFLCSGYNIDQMLLLFRMCSAGVSDICASSNLSDQYQLLAWISTDQRWCLPSIILYQRACSMGSRWFAAASRVSRGKYVTILLEILWAGPMKGYLGWSTRPVWTQEGSNQTSIQN
jgi:hypothetical protein